ncbi:MAG: alpha/beta hydrolase [Terricaulis sp.]
MSTVIQNRFMAACVLAIVTLVAPPAHAENFTPSRFSARVEGHGPDVILIPGLASSRDTYAAEAAKLEVSHRLHLVQIAGFAGEPAGANAQGEVIAPFVEELDRYIKANHLDHPAVIGHSLGGLAGLMLARRHPEDVSRLMVVDALPFFSVLVDPNATAASVAPQAAAMRDRIAAQSDADFAAGQGPAIARMVLTPEQRPAVVGWSTASDRSVLARAMYEDMTTDMRGELAQIQTPITVLYAFDASMGFPDAAMDGLWRNAYAAAPHATLTRIDHSYHFIPLDQPEAFDAAVQAFLR